MTVQHAGLGTLDSALGGLPSTESRVPSRDHESR
jgi:hypothetical protein